MRIPIRGPSTVNEKTGSSQASPLHASISLHPVSAKEALIVKVTPPHAPVENIDPTNPPHVACDIVLVIDVSGSMGAPADVPGEVESTGLSVLDLTKHAAMTIIETLNEGDRLGIVTFGSKSNIVLNLTSMDKTNKDKAREKVRDIESRDATNLWHGMLDGIKVLRQGKPSSRVPALMILTDGKPNHMCPEQGYIPKLRSLYPVSGSEKSLPGSEKSLPGSIHTFGFGYNLESGLLKAIAEFGGGNYAFIPDAGMIGTVFVHAVANLQSTFATKAVLTLSYQEPLSLEEIRGDYIGRLAPKSDGPESTLALELGNLQYGQTRDIYISAKGIGEDPFDEKGVTSVAARLDYFPSGGKRMGSADATCSMLADAELSPNEIAYHESRTLISKFLASIFPANFKDVYQALKHEQLKAKVAELPELIKELPAQKFEDELNKSLVEDLAGEEPRGQISIALRTPEYFRKWGTHYLPSIHNAHTRQICNSFKDSGPQQYGKDSPLFRACRDLLDNAFDQLPAPEPSAPHLRYAASSSPPTSNHHPFSNQPFSMSRYHNPAGSCFAGSTPVELASGRRVAIRKLRRGVKVRTPAGARKVAVVLKTPVTEETMCQVKGGILVTPWHPIAGDTDAKAWGFPAYVTERNVRYTGFVYSVMLQRGDGNPRSHALRVGDVWGVTLGHGIVSGNDSRAHAFFGDYRRVAKAFLGMGIDKAGVVVGAGVERDRRTGVVSGFRQPPPLLDQECVVS